MHIALPIILGFYIILLLLRHFVIKDINKRELTPFSLKENSITFIKIKDKQKDKKSQLLLDKYNIITAFLWGLTLIVLTVVIIDNISRF